MNDRVIRLFNGTNYAFENPQDYREFDVESLAHSLAQLPRFLGHQRNFVSVAEHSVLVSLVLERELRRKDLAFEGLMHDAHEPLSGGDVPRPFKRSRAFDGFNEFERRTATQLRATFRLPSKLDPITTQADLMVFAAEVEQNMNGPRGDFECPYPAAKIELQYWDWREAKYQFLQRYYALQGQRHDEVLKAISQSESIRGIIGRSSGLILTVNWLKQTPEFARLSAWINTRPPRDAQDGMLEWINILKADCFATVSPELESVAWLCVIAVFEHMSGADLKDTNLLQSIASLRLRNCPISYLRRHS